MDDNKGDLGYDDVSFVFCKEMLMLAQVYIIIRGRRGSLNIYTIHMMYKNLSDILNLQGMVFDK